MIEISPTYDPSQYESKWFTYWEDEQLFRALKDDSRKPYGILMPPPNVTSQLHMGHGTCYTFQDLMIRWKRMQGYNALWQPGTDHAGIATQMMVERMLEKEGRSRQQMGREAFVGLCEDWRNKYGGLIYEQFKKIGFSADWKRKAYTMDPHLSKAVRHVFVELFREGLVYRGERLVNWDPVLKTAISDDEVEQKEIPGHLWHLRYPIEGSDRTIIIATTRPETMLGDTAVAVHPDDERYKDLIGKQIRLPIVDRLIPIIADDYVMSEFGSGAVKITPAHDPNDFEIGKRHNLPSIEIFNDDASMADVVPAEYRGLDRFVARKAVVKAFKALELFEKEESYKHSVPHSERSKAVVEPKLSKQWYVRMQSLAKPAAEAAREGKLRFYPEGWKKTYLNWNENIQDWCISRQLWWGHRVPIWYCSDCEGVSTGMEDPTTCEHCGSAKLSQDEDVLDTWFSSWLWPLSPMGWPERSEEERLDLDYFYPSNVLMTAPEIINLWVARMIMVGLKFRGEVPFRDLYFSAVVTDKQGRKFSKTLGNGIDPIEVIDKHGADAVRFSAASLAPLGGRISMDVGDFDNGARFINKLWNAARFLFRYIDSDTKLKSLEEVELDLPSRWLIDNLRTTAEAINQNFETYRLNEGVDKIYHYIWGGFCDWALEASKEELSQESNSAKQEAIVSALVYAFEGALRLAHPIIPFVTEELWQVLPQHPDWDRPKSICIASFPDASNIPQFAKERSHWDTVIGLISGIRSARQQVGLAPKTELVARIQAESELVEVFEAAKPWITRMGVLSEFQVAEAVTRPSQSLLHVGRGYECYLPVAGLVDFAKERARVETEINRLNKIVSGLDKKLSNSNFTQRAPAAVIAQTKEQRANLGSQMTALEQSLAAMAE